MEEWAQRHQKQLGPLMVSSVGKDFFALHLIDFEKVGRSRAPDLRGVEQRGANAGHKPKHQ